MCYGMTEDWDWFNLILTTTGWYRVSRKNEAPKSLYFSSCVSDLLKGVNFCSQVSFFTSSCIFVKNTFVSSFIDYGCSLNESSFCFFSLTSSNSFYSLTSSCTNLRFNLCIFCTAFSVSFHGADARFDVWQRSHLLLLKILFLNDYIIGLGLMQGFYHPFMRPNYGIIKHIFLWGELWKNWW